MSTSVPHYKVSSINLYSFRHKVIYGLFVFFVFLFFLYLSFRQQSLFPLLIIIVLLSGVFAIYYLLNKFCYLEIDHHQIIYRQPFSAPPLSIEIKLLHKIELVCPVGYINSWYQSYLFLYTTGPSPAIEFPLLIKPGHQDQPLISFLTEVKRLNPQVIFDDYCTKLFTPGSKLPFSPALKMTKVGWINLGVWGAALLITLGMWFWYTYLR